jgi:D-glycero-D-manno-heptose 1,7-bisphosphate phosphatase
MGVGGHGSWCGEMKSRAIFLDRDGVLNHAVVRNGKPYPPADAKDVRVYEGLEKELDHLKDRGFAIIVVTNQPDVGRGKTSRASVEAINKVIATSIPAIDRFIVCFHDNDDNCDCRKPKPGMLKAGAAAFNVDLSRSYMVGDRKSDVEAGLAAGSRTIFIDRFYNEPAPTGYHFRVYSTSEALHLIMSENSDEKN